MMSNRHRDIEIRSNALNEVLRSIFSGCMQSNTQVSCNTISDTTHYKFTADTGNGVEQIYLHLFYAYTGWTNKSHERKWQFNLQHKETPGLLKSMCNNGAKNYIAFCFYNGDKYNVAVFDFENIWGALLDGRGGLKTGVTLYYNVDDGACRIIDKVTSVHRLSLIKQGIFDAKLEI